MLASDGGVCGSVVSGSLHNCVSDFVQFGLILLLLMLY